jgi:hypothetical protein
MLNRSFFGWLARAQNDQGDNNDRDFPSCTAH